MLYVLVPVGLPTTTTTTDTYFLHHTQASPVPSYRYCSTRIIPSTTSTLAICVLYAILYTPQLLRRLVCTAVHIVCTGVHDVLRYSGYYYYFSVRRSCCETPLLVPIVTSTRTYYCRIRTGINYAEVHPTSILVIGCCPVYVPGVLRTAAGVGTIFSLCC